MKKQGHITEERQQRLTAAELCALPAIHLRELLPAVSILGVFLNLCLAALGAVGRRDSRARGSNNGGVRCCWREQLQCGREGWRDERMCVWCFQREGWQQLVGRPQLGKQPVCAAACSLTSGKFTLQYSSTVLSAALRLQHASFWPGVTVAQLAPTRTGGDGTGAGPAGLYRFGYVDSHHASVTLSAILV